IRVYRHKEQKEILLSVAHIWKIEVTYAVPAKGGSGWDFDTILKEGIENPETVRYYRVFAGSEELLVRAAPGDPVTAVLERIYKDSIKGSGQKKDQGTAD